MPRRYLDRYETPKHYLKALFEYVDIESESVCEPCVGHRAIADYFAEQCGFEMTTNDIDPQCGADHCGDATSATFWNDYGEWEWGITNPPFDVMDQIVPQMLMNCENTIVLARLSFLEPTKARREIYKYYQPDMLIVLPRYCFRLNDEGKRSTDSVTCCWVGWGPEVPRITTVWTEPPPEEKKDKKR